jgi:LCP family protein required for cell wall assembly
MRPDDQAPDGVDPEPPDPQAATVEADTPALADRVEAEERAAAEGRAGDEEPAGDDAEPAEAEERAEDAARTPRAKSLWTRFIAASLVIVSSMAAATAISALVFIADFADGFGGIGGVERYLDSVDGGDPQTILILGSDKRPTDDTGRSDTTILLRVDPKAETISLLSIPRDLRVSIPGRPSPEKFNAAYSYGGPKLTLEVVKRLTGLEINHVVNINFNGFADAVDAINCVFIDVDRQYYVPEGTFIGGEQYSAIDPPINAGYQKLCGLKALQYVRYRIGDNDLVRAARQQDFVREARQKVEPAKLVFDTDYRFDLLQVFKEYTTSDDNLRDPGEVLELMKTFLGARNAVLNEVPFPAEFGETYVTADDAALRQAIAEFEGQEAEAPPDPNGGDAGRGKPDQKPGNTPKPKPEPESQAPALVDSSGLTEPVAQRIAEAQTKGKRQMIRFPIYYPTELVGASEVTDESRAFPIDGPKKYYGYKLVIEKPGEGSGLMEEYYGVSGTNWADPPILENESETREIDGRDYLLFYDGERLRMIGWKADGASYWISNTLLQSLDANEMIEIAKSMRELGA